jgi:predicted metal-binding protein
MSTTSSLEKYIRQAKKSGAAQAQFIQADQVVTGHWVRLKCQYGCGSYGETLTCPPFAPTPEYMQKVLQEYSLGLLLTFRLESGEDEYPVRRQMKMTIAKLERKLFLDGYYGAFGMSSGPCNLCDKCDVDQPCQQPHLARPSMEACGIDVYATLRNVGLELEVVTTDKGVCTFCGLILFQLHGR